MISLFSERVSSQELQEIGQEDAAELTCGMTGDGEFGRAIVPEN